MKSNLQSNPFVLAVGGAIVIGIIAVIVATFWLGPTPEQKQQSITLVQSVVDIEAGTKITDKELTVIPWTTGELPPGAIFNMGTVVNRLAKVKIPKGETVLESMLVPTASNDDLSSDIPLGKRAFTIAINEVTGVGGFASPGNFVDVIVGVKDAAGMPISKTVVEHVKVLAVAQARSITDPTPKLGTNVTLEVSPEEAQKLDVARSLGTLSLVLRNRADKGSFDGVAASKNDLMLNPNVYSDTSTVEIIRGNLTTGSNGVDSGGSQSGAMGGQR
ncbi:Flp pilus assembly protein CpaB [Polynucleobacter sp. UB-Tiil-W10]|uniref:Flp pilus assembly protein CpaB n=1 Tax=Polynucleobacter sp. UB-Tiil-W10 TaxID=1855648 RepID=UPI001C0E6A49|nr:Flp pilus assembly protein CpaB [Polynucleobacter sp. UB-Tiil-W10]MBU3541638.1 Flp pilus assembly protein CpaB [Polynucleobacter sp. UB-Tiil-W10]